jgi:hypothetical protein
MASCASFGRPLASAMAKGEMPYLRPSENSVSPEATVWVAPEPSSATEVPRLKGSCAFAAGVPGFGSTSTRLLPHEKSIDDVEKWYRNMSPEQVKKYDESMAKIAQRDVMQTGASRKDK